MPTDLMNAELAVFHQHALGAYTANMVTGTVVPNTNLGGATMHSQGAKRAGSAAGLSLIALRLTACSEVCSSPKMPLTTAGVGVRTQSRTPATQVSFTFPLKVTTKYWDSMQQVTEIKQETRHSKSTVTAMVHGGMRRVGGIGSVRARVTARSPLSGSLAVRLHCEPIAPSHSRWVNASPERHRAYHRLLPHFEKLSAEAHNLRSVGCVSTSHEVAVPHALLLNPKQQSYRAVVA